jgi:2-methylisocitrate lyase-like PEP mutase family enzyme
VRPGQAKDLRKQCDLLRSLHRAGTPLLLPNVWDAATARAVVAAGFPVVATTSWGVAAALGYEDHEGAPAAEMLAAAARISRCVDVPVTVDAEAGYGMEPEALVAALRDAGAAGCNLEDTVYTAGTPHDHAAGTLRDPTRHAEWLRSVREAAEEHDYVCHDGSAASPQRSEAQVLRMRRADLVVPVSLAISCLGSRPRRQSSGLLQSLSH